MSKKNSLVYRKPFNEQAPHSMDAGFLKRVHFFDRRKKQRKSLLDSNIEKVKTDSKYQNTILFFSVSSILPQLRYADKKRREYGEGGKRG